jgi:hypothetical protein
MTTSVFSTGNDSTNPFLRAVEPTNPFAPKSDEAPADAPEGAYTYRLVQSGPAVPAEECEIPVAAVEVMVRWGTTVLHVAHLTPVRSFWVGEDDGKGKKSDVFLPEEKIGARRIPLVLAGAGGVSVVVPFGATGSVTIAGQPARSVRELVAAGAEPCREIAGAHQIALPAGARAELELNGLSFEIATVNAGRSSGRIKLTGESLPYQGLSLLLHASLLAATALFVPSMAMANEEDGISDQQKYEMMALLSAEATPEPAKVDEKTEADKPGEHGNSGQAAPGDPGKAGSLSSREVNRRAGTAGNGPETYLSHDEALREARDWGMIGILNNMNGSMGPTSPFGREIASGIDPVSGKGNIWGDTIGDAGGAGGLTLSGPGDGGGGPGNYIDGGRIRTVGPGGPPGFVLGPHKVKAPGIMRVGQTIASGHLPADVIQRVVRQNFGRFKGCYEAGLRGNPSLAGRVAVRFVIGHDGEVSNVGNGGSDLPDAGVVSCVTRAFYGLSFPHPETGIVTVTYPIVFTPAN